MDSFIYRGLRILHSHVRSLRKMGFIDGEPGLLAQLILTIIDYVEEAREKWRKWRA